MESFTVFNLVTDLDVVGEVLSSIEQRLLQLHTQGPGRVPPKADTPPPTPSPTEGCSFPYVCCLCVCVCRVYEQSVHVSMHMEAGVQLQVLFLRSVLHSETVSHWPASASTTLGLPSVYHSAGLLTWVLGTKSGSLCL